MASPGTWPSHGPPSTDILDLVGLPFPFGLYTSCLPSLTIGLSLKALGGLSQKVW
jgi:hypothetical protein